ncbi:MAG TPA: GxxExxY protein, partial [Roseiflexaceae bacterium]|nr:GxxExxY protein [Roseiflexaceae bacterium]
MTCATRTVVCLGDSLTQGTIGASYVDALRRRLGPGVRVVNAGVDGDTVPNLLRRLDRDVAPHRPDLVVVLVGLNDMGAAYGEPVQRAYYRFVKRAPLNLTPPRFAAAYRCLIAALRERTGAAVALCTLTAIGESPDDPAQALVEAYSAVVQALALQEGLPLIDLRAAFRAAIAADPRPGPPYRIWMAPLDRLAVRLPGASYTALTARRGYRLLCDGVHLAEAGAELVAAVMAPVVAGLIGESGTELSTEPAVEERTPAARSGRQQRGADAGSEERTPGARSGRQQRGADAGSGGGACEEIVSEQSLPAAEQLVRSGAGPVPAIRPASVHTVSACRSAMLRERETFMSSTLVQTPHDEITYKIIGCAMSVFDKLGPGFRENTYQRALAASFGAAGLFYEAEKCLEVYDSPQKTTLLGYYIPDFLVAERVVVEIKALPMLNNTHLAQIIGYLAVTGYPVGLLINFGARRLQRRRIFP